MAPWSWLWRSHAGIRRNLCPAAAAGCNGAVFAAPLQPVEAASHSFRRLLISLLHNHDAGVLWRNTAISIAHWFDYVSRLRTAGTVDAFRHDARRMRYGARATSSSGAHRHSASGARG